MTLFDNVVMGWSAWMIAMTWQVGLLVLLVAVVDHLLSRRLWPAVRYAMWLVVLLKLVLPPTFALPTAVVPRALAWAHAHPVVAIESWLGSPESAEQRVALAPGREETGAVDAASSASATVDPGGRDGFDAGRLGVLPWLRVGFGVWLAGMIGLVGALTRRLARLRRWHREERAGRAVPEWFHTLLVTTARRLDLARLPSVVFTDELPAPAVFGLRRPVLFLPARYLDELSPTEAEHVLLHELGHVKRGDLWVNAIALVLQIVYWFHPLVVYARRRLRDACEICCDLTVARRLREQTPAYRTTLMSTARRMLTESVQPGLGLLGIFEEPFRLVQRMRWLETRLWENRAPMRSVAAAVGLALVAFVLPMSGSSPSAALRAGMADAGILAGTDLPEEDAASGATGSERAFYVRDVTRTEARFVIFRTESEIVHVNELWLGDDRVAQVDAHKTIVYAPADARLLVINHDERTYVEMPLPLDIADHASVNMARDYAETQSGALVQASGGTRTVLGYPCQEYEVSTWESREEVRHNENSFRVWAATEAPGDLDLLRDFIEHLRLLYNRSPSARRELEQIQGYQLRLARSEWHGLWRRSVVNEAVEMAWRQPPAGLFDVPDGYEAVEKLTHDDLR